MDTTQCTAEYWLYYTMADNWKGIFTKSSGKDVPHNSMPDSNTADKDMPDHTIAEGDKNTPDITISSDDMTPPITTSVLNEPLYKRSELDLGWGISTATDSPSELF
jgi:hypothetical protein